MKKYLLPIASVFLLGCTKPDVAISALQSSNYTNIKITGFAFAACGRKDIFRTGFTATRTDGQFVKGVVCGEGYAKTSIKFE